MFLHLKQLFFLNGNTFVRLDLLFPNQYRRKVLAFRKTTGLRDVLALANQKLNDQ
jgi:hypothetical protein